MGAYEPLHITGNTTGLVQGRENFLLPDDAYPVLENAYIWRERIRRRQGYELLGRLIRNFTAVSISTSGASPWTFTIFSTVTPAITEPNAQIVPGSVVIVIGSGGGAITFTDQGNGTLTSPTGGNSGTINYSTGSVTLTHTAGAGVASTITFGYYPSLPVMGLRSRELNNINFEQLVAFDQTYAYIYNAGWQEFIPGTTWTGSDSNFFWSTNFWITPSGSPNPNSKIFWVTNFSGVSGDPIRYTDGSAWINFAPTINAAGDQLTQCLAMLPFRGRLVTFNTFEGANLASSLQKRQRIRWAAIGTPISDVSTLFPSGVNPNAWRDDIRGQGGYLDIPTSENIVSVGFVRDNLVIYCERSTWQLRYVERSIAPFQIEKVNSELGAESTFSAVQFDTSLVGIGDKGVVECDSYKSERIDIKIPDLIYQFRNANNGAARVHGIRDIQQRLAYWTYPYNPGSGFSTIFPNRRLVYNYENDSWAIFTDSLTTLGTYQSPVQRTWASATYPWSQANFPWLDVPAQFPSIVGGNQQGYVEYLSSNLEPKVSNDVSLYIYNITGNTTTPTVITSVNHNLQNGQVIKITGLATTDPFYANINDGIFGVIIVDKDNFQLWQFNPFTGNFDTPELDAPGTYIGGAQIAIRDGFSIISKKFNFIDQGENIQLGFIDLLVNSTSEGAISLNLYLDYNDNSPINILPQNINPSTNLPDPFFNSTVPTSQNGGISSSKNWQRVICPVRGNFITIEWTLSNTQLVGVEQESDVQIDAQILYLRTAGRKLALGA